MTRPTQLSIDLAALSHNFQHIKTLAPNTSILAMVKSNAYGHGLTAIAKNLPDADALGVACIEEGTQLRQAGIRTPIVLMEGLFGDNELPRALEQQFTLVVHNEAQVTMLEAFEVEEAFTIWLKIDTGMHRLGFSIGSAPAMYQRLLQCKAVKKPIGLMTHFAEADVIESHLTTQQIDLFNATTKGWVGPRSLANSSAILAWPAAHADWIRPGIMLYGASPLAGYCGAQHGLRPVMSLTSEIIAIHDLKKGDRVGYGGTWICTEDMRVGVVAIGYGDGYPRHAKNGTPILVNGKRCGLIGRVSMDMINVDLRTQPQTEVGAPVLLWGADLPVEVVAEYSETSAYELLTRITQRVRVEFVGVGDY